MEACAARIASSVAATARVRMGMRRAEGRRIDDLHGAAGGGWRTIYRNARHPGTWAGGHFARMPTRSLYARGGVATGDDFRMAEVSRRSA